MRILENNEQSILQLNIIRLRDILNLSLAKFGELIDVSSPTSVSQWETGTTTPTKIKQKAIAEFCGTSPEMLNNKLLNEYDLKVIKEFVLEEKCISLVNVNLKTNKFSEDQTIYSLIYEIPLEFSLYDVFQSITLNTEVLIDIKNDRTIQINVGIVSEDPYNYLTIDFNKLLHKHFISDNKKRFEVIMFLALTSIYASLIYQVKTNIISSKLYEIKPEIKKKWKAIEKNGIKCNIFLSVAGNYNYEGFKLFWPYSFLSERTKQPLLINILT